MDQPIHEITLKKGGHGRDCTDNFRIKWWKWNHPNDYNLTKLLEPTMRSFVITGLQPNTKYEFEVKPLIYLVNKIPQSNL